jgi:alkylglycerol monooxygenase
MLNAVALLIPLFLFVVLFEWYVSYKRKDNRYTTGSIAMNLTIGAIDQISSLVYFGALYFVMQYVYNHFRIFETSNFWYQWVAGYIAVDFLSYWYHRLSHRVNILWAGHVTHHSSELFNLSNGFRTSLFQGINRIMFWALLPVFGFSPVVLVIILKISGIYDFLLHTEYIPKLGFLEKILITPSMHRVHHGRNDIYIDKNYGSTFLIWDKLFGTFQEETETVRYGIKSDYVDNNPFTAIGHHYQYIWRSMKATAQWPDKIKLLFMPPEWKPQDLADNRQAIRKKNILISSQLKQYAYFQLSCCVAGFITMLIYQDFLSAWEIIICSIFGIITMSNSTMIINESAHVNSEKQELTKLTFGLFFILVCMFLYSSNYLWSVIIFLTASLALILTTHQAIKMGSQ